MTRLYRLLLKLYPRAHRERFESGLLASFQSMASERRYGGFAGRLRLVAETLYDVSTTALLIRVEGHATRKVTKRMNRPFAGAGAGVVKDVLHSLRRVRRRPGFALVAMLTLGIGVGANVLVLSVVHPTLLSPLPYPEPDRVVSLWPQHWFTRAELAHVEEGMETLTVAGSLGVSFSFLEGDEPTLLDGLEVSPRYFEVFGVEPLIGRTFQGGDGPDAKRVVLSEGVFRSIYAGDSSVVGSTMVLDGESYAIIGVMPRHFAPLPLDGQVFVPMEMNPASGRYEGTNEAQLVGRLRAGASTASAREELRSILHRRVEQMGHRYDEDFGADASVSELKEAVVGDVRRTFLVLQAAVLFVMLMASINVAHIVLAGASTRANELALRRALGAGRFHIVRELAAESVVLAAGGTLTGLASARALLPVVTTLLPFETPSWLEIGIDAPVLALTMGLIGSAVVVFGLLPALLGTGGQGGMRARSHRRAARPRGFLVASEVALVTLLLIGAGLLVRSFSEVLRIDLGFRTDETVTMRLRPSPERYEEDERVRIFYRDVLERVRALPGVAEASVVNRLPLRGAWFTAVEVENLPSEGDRGHSTQWSPVDPSYFRLLGLPSLAGRLFDGTERPDSPPLAVVNETFVERYLEGDLSSTRRVRFTGGSEENAWMTIVGVVGNVKQNGPRGFDFPMLYLPFEQSPLRSLYLVARFDGEAAALGSASLLRRAVWDVDPNVPISDVATMDEVLSHSVADARLPAVGITVFAAIALVLGASGIYGVISYLTSRREREIGILYALGAERRHVEIEVMSSGMKPVATGIAAGLLASFALSRYVASLLYEVSPTDPGVATSVVILLLATAAAATYLPARRAGRLDPTRALRSE